MAPTRMLLVAAVVVLAACGSSNRADNEVEATTSTAPPTMEKDSGDTGKPLGDSSVSTDQPTSTKATTTTTPPDPYALWGEAVASARLSAGPSSAGLLLYGLRSDGRYVELMKWTGAAWEVDYELDFEYTPEKVDDLWLADVTGDGVDDAVVGFRIASESIGEVFVPDGSRFRSVPIDNIWLGPSGVIPNPSVNGATVSALVVVCEPSCADGPVMSTSYRWEGSRMVAQNPRCTDMRSIDYDDPSSICTSGEVVRRLQEALNYFEYMSDSPDGLFGPLTRQGVVRYQRDVGMFESGWLEPDEVISLIEYYNDSLYYAE